MKCKYCCQEIVLDKEVWLDGSPVIRSICLSSPILLHIPDTDVESVVDKTKSVFDNYNWPEENEPKEEYQVFDEEKQNAS